MSFYQSRLERDLQRWQSLGYVTETGAASIRADAAASGRKGIGAAQVFAILGAVLFGFAVMSFVAANWSGMSKLARLALLLGTLWACYAGAAVLFARQMQAFAHAAILGGIAVYGASIMLIAQMYHMEGNPPDAVLLWALGALVAAVLTRSPVALAATFVLAVVWTHYERIQSDDVHLPFLVLWAAAAALAYFLQWRPGLHLAALSLVSWLVPLGHFVLDQHAHWIVVLLGLAAAAASSAASKQIDEVSPISSTTFTYAVATAFAGLFILQFLDEHFTRTLRDPTGLRNLVLLAVLTLALLLGAMIWGIHTGNRAALWLAYTGFAIEIFTLYIKTFGDLLNTSLFFLVAAIIVSGLAWLAYRLHNRKDLAMGIPS